LRVKTLRPEVTLRGDGGNTSISFAHWQVTLPADSIQRNSALVDFVTSRRIDPHGLDDEARGLFALLDAQGCFLLDPPNRLTAREVLRLFQPLRSQLYAQYYSHSTWGRLRSGEASRGELTAWMTHNYHVSRSAGVIAARMAIAARDPGLKAFFREDALEEYWHCDAFYFVEQADINLTAADVKNYVPLPASTAFEDHALRAAEEDPLGHLLIAYFQESSIIFRQDSERFYDTIEANYGLKDAFKGWRKHMTLDLDHDHAGELEARFDDGREITLEEAKASLRTVQLAQFFLLKALDQIAEHCQVANAVRLRLPTALALSDQSGGSIKLRRSSALFFLAALRDAAFRALALARTHDQIIAIGRLASKLDSVSNKLAVDITAPWHIACRNFLVERAVEPEVVIALARMFLGLIARGCPELADVAGLGLNDETDVAPDPRIDVAFYRLRELIVLAATEEDLPALKLV
jgi:hypothetical protein